MVEIIEEGCELDLLLKEFCEGEGKKRQKRGFVYSDESPIVNFGGAISTPKVGRNDPCPCGSGKKYKKCCLNK